MKNFIVIFLLITSCGNQSPINKGLKDNKTSDTVSKIIATQSDNPLLYRGCINLDVTEYSINDSKFKQALIDSFKNDLGNIKPDNILSISKELQSLNIDSFGLCSAYKIILSNDLPSVTPKKMFLLANNTSKKVLLIPFDELQPIKINKKDSFYFLAGTYLVRSKGYFMIYKYDNVNGFKTIFNSLSDSSCPNGIAVYNSSLDCVSYQPFMLKFQNIDIDNDGYNDLVFSGKLMSYCEGLETGYGRNDRQPKSITDLSIQFKTVTEGNSFTWKFVDTTLCKKLSE
jgi:hypothetical protein